MTKQSLSHNDRLGTIGESTRTVVDRIMATWNKATPADVEAGAQWYGDGERIVDDLATRGGITREAAAAVIAHLSPRNRWAANVHQAMRLIIDDVAVPGTMSASVERARKAMASEEPLTTLNGPKTARFARNLLGDRTAVTVDVWAVRVALGDRDDAEAILSRVGMYAAIEHAYRLAAARAGVDPTTMQATTWIVARGRAD